MEFLWEIISFLAKKSVPLQGKELWEVPCSRFWVVGFGLFSLSNGEFLTKQDKPNQKPKN